VLFLRVLCIVLLTMATVTEPVHAGRGKRRRCCCCRVEPVRVSSETRATALTHKPSTEVSSSPQTQNLFDGKTLTGWKIADKFTFDAHGDVRVRDGKIELAAGSPATGIVWAGQPPRRDYELSLEAMRTDGSDFFCGVTFPVGKEYCSLIIGGWGGGLVGLSNVDSIAANENETTNYQEFEENKWYRIRLRVVTGRIDVWIDNQQVIKLETANRGFDIWWEQEPMRPLGIATWYTGAAFRDISIRRLAEE